MVRTRDDLLDELRDLVTAHARPDLQTPIDGLLLSRVTQHQGPPEYSLTEPLPVSYTHLTLPTTPYV